ncbi:MAG TPA: WD40 repeat domain-containing protein, partial [Urbifossiella sp.]|nr:WD40 repeat domain-containing protein [Urbifossiella sp.]
AALAAAAGRTLPVRSAVVVTVGMVALALAGLAPGRPPHSAVCAPIPPAAETGEVPLPDGAVRRFGTARSRVGDGPLAVTPDGKSVVAVSPQGRVRVLDARTGRVTSEYLLPLKAEAFYTGTTALLSANGSTAVTQVWNADATGNTLTAWDLPARRPLWSWTTVNGGTVETAALTADGKRVFVVELSADRARSKVKAVDLVTGRERVVFDRANPVSRLLVSPDGKRVVLVRGDRDDRLATCHDAETGAKLWETARFGSVAAFSPDGAVLFSECRDPSSRVLALDAQTGEPAAGLKFPDQTHEMSLAPTPSPDGRTVLVGDAKLRGFVIWDYRDGKEVGVVPGYAYEGGYPRRSAVFSRDGKVLFTGLDRLRRWDAATGQALDPADPADGHASPVAGVRYSPDGREVYSLDTRSQYRRWAADGRLRDGGEAKPDPTRNPDDRGGVTRAGDTTMVFDRFPVAGMVQEKAPDPGAPFARFPTPPLYIAPVAGGRRAVTLTDESVKDGRRFFVTTQSGLHATRIELPWSKAVPAHPVSPCGRWVVVGGTVYSTATGRAVLAPEAPGVGGRPARLASDSMRFEKVWFSPDGRFVAGTLDWQDGTPRGMRLVAVWELASGTAFPAVPVHSYHDAAVSPGGRTLVDGGIHGITAHELIGGKSLRLTPRDLTTGFDYRRSQPIGFHPAGRAFVTGHVDGSVVEWAVPHAARAAAAPGADAAWADLASPDLRAARAAVERLVDHPDAAAALLKARFAPPAGGPAEGVVSGDLLRGVRAVEVLERTASAAARALLTEWRNQARSPRHSAEAAFALDRLGQAGSSPD